MNLPNRYWVAYVSPAMARWSIEDHQFVFLLDAIRRRDSLRQAGLAAEVVQPAGWEVVE